MGPRGEWACVRLREFQSEAPPGPWWSASHIGPATVVNPDETEIVFPPPGTMPIDPDAANVLTTISGAMSQEWIDVVRLESDVLRVSHIASLDRETAQVNCTRGVDCRLSADAWSIGQSGFPFTYALRDEPVSFFDTLTPEESTICFISGVLGYPEEDADISLTTGHADGLWHVHQTGTLWGYATCLPYEQGW